MRLNIGTKMVLAFLVVTMAISTAGYFSLIVLEGASLDSIGDNLDDPVALATETIGLNIANRMDELHWYAAAASLPREASLSNQDFDAMPDREIHIASTERDWVAGKQTKYIQDVLDSQVSEALKRHCENLSQEQGYPLFTEIFVTNKYGVVIGATGRTSDYQQSDEQWYRAAVANGSWIGDVARDASSNSLAMDLVVALKDRDGTTVGTLKGVLNIEYVTRLVRYIANLSRYRSTRAYLVNRDGRAILHSRTASPSPGQADFKAGAFGRDLSGTEAVSQALKVDHGHAVIIEGNRRNLAVFSRLKRVNARPETENLGWALIMEYDADELLQPVLTAKRSLLFASLAVTTIAILAGIVFSRSISGRIGRLTETAAQIAEANTAAKVHDIGNDEIGVLARTFNQMTQNLFEAHARLEAKNAELRQFNYTVSHDLQTPLITIKGFVGVLEEDLANGDLQQVNDHLSRIAAATDKMNELLHDLLELSRVGRASNMPEDVALMELIREVLELAEGDLEMRGVRTKVPPELPVVHGDRVRLRAVLQNLVVNAAQHMGDQADPCIEIDAHESGDRVVCHVRDNGVGIEPRYQDKIFGLFNKLDTRGRGTGIGLALAKRIVEVHQGRIWVESEGLGKGTTFCFDLPCATGADGSEEAEA